MNNISFSILPSPDTNDNEVRILVDNVDLLGNDYLGIDSLPFFSRNNLDKNGIVMVGRCTCGVEGCCDYPVTIAVVGDKVTWTVSSGLTIIFDKAAYNSSIEKARNDYSWEDIKRKVERLATEVLQYSIIEDGYRFDWASARINNNEIVLSYSRNGTQKMFRIFWDGRTENEVRQNAEAFLKQKIRRQ